ncbi:MAG: hypothetical protein H8E16_11165 [Flavobacteriales bacterium]|nr:hypothetical protein [Flavobacteriales bacterium]|tara:strand:- start:735 stop:1202 length:468 start_codon:yes stop_codon:yes gene_type:complete
MGYCNADIEKAYHIDLSDDNRLSFEKKYKDIVDLFEGELFVKNEDGKTYLISDRNFEFSTRDFSTKDDGLPNKSRAIARFFGEVTEYEGDTDFEFGQSGFSTEFYSDLFNLLEDCDWGDFSFCASINCNGESGYYSGQYELLEKGFYASFVYYDN